MNATKSAPAKRDSRLFGVLQRVGRSFMLPIALLPIAGLLLGVGASLTNAAMIESYGLENAAQLDSHRPFGSRIDHFR